MGVRSEKLERRKDVRLRFSVGGVSTKNAERNLVPWYVKNGNQKKISAMRGNWLA